jgi:signal transduction histidine kinase
MGPEIVEFLTHVDTPDPAAITTPHVADSSIHLISDISESLYAFDVTRLEAAIVNARALTPQNSESLDQALRFSEGILDVFKTSEPDTLKENLTQYFESFDARGDWYIQSTSDSLAGFVYISRNRLLDAAGHISTAMQLIPAELSPRVTAARLLASEGALALHGMQGNPEFMLEAARVQRHAKADVGEDVDRHELMTNFVYALNRARDYEGAAQVAELLIIEPRSQDAIPGLSEVYMAETFNEMGDYVRANMLATTAVQGTPHPVVDQRGHHELLVALAGQGEINRARVLMDYRGWTYSSKDLLESVNAQSILHAEALIAMHRGESGYALALMKRRTDILIGRIQGANSGNMTAMLSNLENTRERQSEREGALQREAELRAVQLEQKTKLNRMLWVLIGGLTVAFNFLLAFLRYREKLNVKVQGLQEDALSSEKMKTEFLGVINHELRTPLNGIIGISDAMIHHANSPVMREQAQAVQESGQLLFDLLDSLITMSTIEGDRLSLDKDEVSLSTAISREIAEWDEAASKKGLTFTQFIAPELNNRVIADHKRIRQSLRYLLSNAVRFTHAGRVHLHATAEPDKDGHIIAKIIVADTGQGISEDVQSRLFQPFLQADASMTRKYGGAGLSLAIARKLARMMDGDVVVKSREGRGTEFTFTARLPLAETRVETAKNLGRDSAAHPVPGLENIEAPEEIIDLMLNEQLSGDTKPTPRKHPFKAAS